MNLGEKCDDQPRRPGSWIIGLFAVSFGDDMTTSLHQPRSRPTAQLLLLLLPAHVALASPAAAEAPRPISLGVAIEKALRESPGLAAADHRIAIAALDRASGRNWNDDSNAGESLPPTTGAEVKP